MCAFTTTEKYSDYDDDLDYTPLPRIIIDNMQSGVLHCCMKWKGSHGQLIWARSDRFSSSSNLRFPNQLANIRCHRRHRHIAKTSWDSFSLHLFEEGGSCHTAETAKATQDPTR